jgi:Zc3h12a-like Ribonuclease NYN domain
MKNLNYIKATVIQASTIIELDNIHDFFLYMELHAVKEIFLVDKSSKFALLSHHSLFQIPTYGYQTIEDAKKAVQNHFPDSQTYYEALKVGITKYEEYELTTVYGITDKTVFEKIKAEGYFAGFKKYKVYIEEQKESFVPIATFANLYELYTFAKKNGFYEFEEFFAAFKHGFITPTEFNIAQEKGFENGKDYKNALEMGFQDNDDYQKALRNNIKSYTELLQKENLEISYPDSPHDQNLLLFLLSKLEQGKKVSVNKLHSLLESSFEEYFNPETKKLPSWFTKSFKKTQDISQFLINDINVKKFGFYDNDGEFFEINTIKDRSIVIDGSNVAHNSKKGKSDKPMVANLITIVKFLKSKGFNDILIIADASLSHKLGDPEKLEELEKEAEYRIAPAQTSADTFLISYVKSKHCLLLSNDTFKQYKITDSWTAANVDYYRLTFMITEGEVFMPDLK